MADDIGKQLPIEALKFWLEEYKALWSDIQSRITLQHGLLNFQFIFIGAFIAFVATTLKDGTFIKYKNQLDFFIFIAPIIFSMFVWRHSNHDVNIIYKAKYIYWVLRPKISEATGDTEVLKFEDFLYRNRAVTGKRFGVFAVLGNEHFFQALRRRAWVAAFCRESVVPNFIWTSV